MINTLILLISLQQVPTYPKETIFGIFAFDFLYNGLRVGFFSKDPFYKGFIKGAALGICQFSVKAILGRQDNTYAYLPLKTIFNICNSGTDNLQFRRGFLDQIAFSFGFGTYVYQRNKPDYVSFNPSGISRLVETLMEKKSLDIKNTILTLQPIFYDPDGVICSKNAAGCYASGLTYIKSNINRQRTLNHELNHDLFYDSFIHIDEALDKYLFTLEVFKYIDLHYEIMTILTHIGPYAKQPQEIEAYTLTR